MRSVFAAALQLAALLAVALQVTGVFASTTASLAYRRYRTQEEIVAEITDLESRVSKLEQVSNACAYAKRWSR
jgi:hypothetical protein